VGKWREITNVHTVTADKYKRVRLPDAKPQQVFAYANTGDGSITLTPVKAERKPAFPRASLLKYLTPERDKEQLAILSGCVQTPPHPERRANSTFGGATSRRRAASIRPS
jgi:hypothetical protein